MKNNINNNNNNNNNKENEKRRTCLKIFALSPKLISISLIVGSLIVFNLNLD